MSAKQRILDYIIDTFDPRASNQVGSSNTRIGEIDSATGTRVVVEDVPELQLPPLDLRDFEGRGIMTSMSDRTAGGGILTQIDGVPLSQPVKLEGGQNFMFLNPGQTWASGNTVVNSMMREAQKLKAATGKDPLYAPHMMAPGGMDFSTMPGDAILSYIDSTASKKLKNELNQKIRQVVPEWKGFGGDWYEEFSKLSGAKKKKIQTVLDANRDKTGIGSGKGRVVVTAPDQLSGRDGTLLNIGQVNTAGKITPSTHRTYPMNLPGEGLGRINKDDVFVTQLFPETVDQAGKVRKTADINNPKFNDIRPFQMRPIGGVIDEKMLRRVYGSMGGMGILGALTGGSDQAMASPVPGGMTMPSMKDVRSGIASQQSSADQDATNMILEAILNFMAPTSIGGGVDTMEGYQRSQVR